MSGLGVLFFGCWRQSGHFLRAGTGVMVPHRELPPAFSRSKLDAGYCPPRADEPEGLARLHHVADWTVLAWWDRSVDRRMRSNAALLAQGAFTFDEMIALGCLTFPSIMARFTYAIRLEAG